MSTPLEQVMAAAAAVAQSGHTPSLALIKARLSNKLPMPLLVEGLQRFKSLPESEREKLTQSEPRQDEAAPQKPVPTVEVLQQEISQLRQEQQQLKQEFAALQQRLAKLEGQQ
ncbi:MULTISPECIES: hypothetical protein [Shewanella]|uniref:KfrA N-terminal DNA-binding domain-containing protein n=1 Tax=Shewanella chilikensis TaxID=558541 RepID=A0ABX5PQ03_9GAMM|nr:hypothetical protein [Shewanella chilikensis]MCE9853938.1 hypothetical protein [Shewanella chilikensis]MCL1152455.1 hypothetical protein [Shewanella chilikensis]PYE59218.1 hypothetical protein C8J23_10975 [Shewanella chilikensis]GGZ25293.1 hypothetical protein GCM10007105_11170 [Shewanella chilikensis]